MIPKTPTKISPPTQQQEINFKQAKYFFSLGKVFAKKNEWKEASAAYRRAIKLAPDWKEARQSLSYAENQLQEKTINTQQQIEPSNKLKISDIPLDKIAKQEEQESAIYTSNNAVIVNSNLANEYHVNGDIFLKKGEKVEAIKAYEKAIEINSELWEVHHKLGNLLQENGDLEAAVTAYNKSIELKPDFCWSYHNLADALVKLENLEEAVCAYQKAIKLEPNFVWLHYNLAEILVKIGNFYEAIAAYRSAIKLQPDLPKVYEKLGDALQQQMELHTKEAVNSYQQAIKQNPDDIELYHKALEVKPNDPELYLQLCQTLVRQNELDEAMIFYQMGLQAQSTNQDTSTQFDLMKLGNYCVKQGKLKEAIFFYQEALKNNRDNDLISWQLQNIKAMKNREFFYPLEVVEDLRLLEPRSLILNTSDRPIISIIIPVYNQILHTYNCLRSLAETLDESLPFEVIVMDDHSSDNTQEVLSKISGVKSVFNEQNLGFIGSCNRGAEKAKGEYLIFLNNDTVVMPNCFQEMLETFKQIPDAGLVGAKFLYPNGKLQEAGGIIWQDGSAWNYGRLDHPNKPEYCYLREVDYCSGAGIMIPTKLWRQIGGFDVRYKPAYYEDTDLAFEVRKAGYKVLYQPLAKIVHFEGISSGTDVNKGVKKYQVVNHQKFMKKWQDVLKLHRPNAVEPHFERERPVQKRLLMIDACMLTPDQDSGSVTAFNLIKIFQSLDYKVTFAPDNLLYVEKYTEDLQRLGVECLYCSYVTSIISHLETYGSQYDVVYLARLEFTEKYIDKVKKFAPQATIIYDTVDLHYLREQREAKIKNSSELNKKAINTKERELALMAKADCTLVVSMMEKQMLEKENPHLKNIDFFHMPRDIYGAEKGFADRKNILFIGGFQHPPNVDAVLYFVQEVFPLVKQKIDDIKIFIIGSKAPEEILNLSSDDVIITGHVPDVSEYFNNCKMSVAPLRYGAGIKGKILTSFSYGLPVVATPIAAEGMGIKNGYDVLIGKNPKNFAQQVANLYSDNNLWSEISQNSLETISSRYSMAAVTNKFNQLLRTLKSAKQ
ncbi:MAG: tetratricopeptide repeat protein [Okeania sp. SIO3B5]|uniref:tetratricopeptide repeat protein n=1 Tax=Okeania sp. SIO3B5 TaxID=2607811 RepID=UPI0014012C13|nr:tetratricopeptide repeat protein [Okeania sp. SIO3B5]NEO57838.1 tetratricopeptide repeat protein [Okeania sp. SIO3B5]